MALKAGIATFSRKATPKRNISITLFHSWYDAVFSLLQTHLLLLWSDNLTFDSRGYGLSLYAPWQIVVLLKCFLWTANAYLNCTVQDTGTVFIDPGL